MIKDIMDSGAQGVELVVKGKLSGKGGRKRKQRVAIGYLKKRGYQSRYVDKFKAAAYPKAGAIGITLAIVHPDVIFPDKIDVNEVVAGVKNIAIEAKEQEDAKAEKTKEADEKKDNEKASEKKEGKGSKKKEHKEGIVDKIKDAVEDIEEKVEDVVEDIKEKIHPEHKEKKTKKTDEKVKEEKKEDKKAKPAPADETTKKEEKKWYLWNIKKLI